MRVLMLSWEYPPNVVGGMGQHVAELVPALAQEGLELHLVTPTYSQEGIPSVVENGVVVHRVFIPTIKTQASIYDQTLAVNKALENYAYQIGARFDLIHVHDWLTGFAGIALQQAWGCPLIATIHATERGRNRGHLSNELQRFIDQAERDLVHQAQRVIVCSRHMAHEVQYFFQVRATKLDIIPNGINIANLRNGYNREELVTFRTKYANPDDQIVFTISRLVYEKGIHLLIQAAPRILAACPQTRFIIAGKGPEAKNLKQQAENLGVAGRVNFIGFISYEDRDQLFTVADCAIFPSLYEPFGIVALEAMALGCPLVVSDVGGLAEMVEHAETGIKIYPDNVDSTAWGIMHALTHPDRVKQYALKARQSVELLFNWPRIGRLTIEVYRRGLEQNADSTASTSQEST